MGGMGSRRLRERRGWRKNTIRKRLRDLDTPEGLAAGRVRKPGAGAKRRTDVDQTLLEDLERPVDGDTRGDPERPLLWTSKSVRKLARELRDLGHQVSYRTVAHAHYELSTHSITQGPFRP